MPTWLALTIAAAYGLVLGSFLNVVIHRLPRGMSLVRPRSHCPRCGATVAWYDNLPVVSFLALGGRCRRCKARISVRYPMVELGTAALLGASVSRFGLSVWGAEAVVLVLLLLPLALIDLEHHLLPDWLTLPGVALGLLFSLAGGLVTPVDAAIGTLVGAVIPLAVIAAYRAIRGVEGMGLGDVKLLAMIGAFLGWRGALLTLCIGACAGALVGVGMIVAGKGRSDTELPFGTFLSAAAAIVLFFGGTLMHWLGWAVL
jgi:leader peptidase (prepilin peptidase)/N-methyltransferase